MKKKLVAVASLLLALLMSLASFGGCNLVTTDSKKDMEQVVATVGIQEGISEDITKQDVVMDYLNYGYSYVQYQGYTMAQVMELIVYNRINSMILVQNAKAELNKNTDNVKDSSKGAWDATRYLDPETDLVEAEYSVYKGVADMLDSFATEKDPVKVQESSGVTVRTTPNGAANDDEVSLEKKKEYLAEKKAGFDRGSTAERREAFNKLINFFKINNLIGEDYKNNDLTTTTYFQTNLKNALDDKVLEVYREKYQRKSLEELGITFETLEELYNGKYNDQKEWSNAEFVEALDNATADSPVLYGVNGTYGYVYNLLLGVDDIQEERINAIDANLSTEKKSEQTAEILASTRVQDLRSSWITAGYDFNIDTKEFTGDYTFTSKEGNSLEFKGEVECLNPNKAEKEEYEYKVSANYMNLDQFIKGMNAYMTSGKFNIEADVEVKNTAGEYSDDGLKNAIYGAGTYKTDIEEYDEKINEMLFAFSTDDGSLNKYKGYVIKPEVDATNSEQYVTTFATAGRKLLELGGQSYVIVASKFGYHVMFFSEVFKAGEESTLEQYATLTDYLNKNYGEKDWLEYFDNMQTNWFDFEDTDNYLYILQSSICSNIISNKLNREERNMVNKYLYPAANSLEVGSVVINQTVYDNLAN